MSNSHICVVLTLDGKKIYRCMAKCSVYPFRTRTPWNNWLETVMRSCEPVGFGNTPMQAWRAYKNACYIFVHAHTNTRGPW